MTAQLLPDPCHVKRSQARDIAEGLVQFFRVGDVTRIWLYVAPNGDVMYATEDSSAQFGPLSLVGVYTASSSVPQITGDILAMEREAIT